MKQTRKNFPCSVSFLCASVSLSFTLLAMPVRADGPVLRVGIDQGDLRGNDHRVLQAGLDYLAALGGGTLHIAPGRYSLRNALMLRSGVRVVGAPGKTILVMGPGGRIPLRKDAQKGDKQVTLAHSTGLRPGDGVILQDKKGHGFEVTTATLVRRLEGDTWQLSQPLEEDYLLQRSAALRVAYSGIAGHGIHDAEVEGLTVEGNFLLKDSETLGGCRGGGIYFAHSRNVVVRHCEVRRYNGDAISFQKNCTNLHFEKCLVEDNANVGFHPGSGSHHCVVKDNVMRNNGYVGLFVCVGVKHVRFLGNSITGNKGCGISIGYDDSDNLFEHNRVVDNAEMAVLFRRDSLEHGAHRNVFVKNIFSDNLQPRPAKSNSRPEAAGKASVVIEGLHHDLVFRDNVFQFTKPHAGPAILFDQGNRNLQVENNRLENIRVLRAPRE